MGDDNDRCVGPLLWFEVNPDERFKVRAGLWCCEMCDEMGVVPGKADVRHRETRVTFRE